MSGGKYDGMKISMLKEEQYQVWKMKMLMFLIVVDPDYIERITLDPYELEIVEAKTRTDGKVTGTIEIKKNKRALLNLEYEVFDCKPNENLTEIYNRFLLLFNELALVGRTFDPEDSNTKFIMALPDEWENKTTVIRGNTDLSTVNLNVIYGRLKTYDLKIQERKC